MTTLARRPVTAPPIRRVPPVDPRALGVAMATAYLEVRTGRRPPAQLDPLLSPAVQRQLQALVRRRRTRRGPAGAYSVRRALVQQRHPGVAEVTVVVQDRDRVRVVAVGLECVTGRWTVVALGAPEDQVAPRPGLTLRGTS